MPEGRRMVHERQSSPLHDDFHLSSPVKPSSPPYTLFTLPPASRTIHQSSPDNPPPSPDQPRTTATSTATFDSTPIDLTNLDNDEEPPFPFALPGLALSTEKTASPIFLTRSLAQAYIDREAPEMDWDTEDKFQRRFLDHYQETVGTWREREERMQDAPPTLEEKYAALLLFRPASPSPLPEPKPAVAQPNATKKRLFREATPGPNIIDPSFLPLSYNNIPVTEAGPRPPTTRPFLISSRNDASSSRGRLRHRPLRRVAQEAPSQSAP
ncbi:hypothetical protein JCM11641_002042 [Rhodosporidiobolus odoratus]